MPIFHPLAGSRAVATLARSLLPAALALFAAFTIDVTAEPARDASGVAADKEDHGARLAEEGETMFQAVEISYPEPGPFLGLIDARSTTSLNGDWRMIVDPMGVGEPGAFFDGFPPNRRQTTGMELIEYDFDTARKIRVPGDFNSQDERLFFYQGRVWYYRTFAVEAREGVRRHLWFGGANFTTRVFLNGEPVGRQRGGYVPFSFDVTDRLHDGENVLMVAVENTLSTESVPTLRTDWWPYGGLTRDVALVETPEAFIRNARLVLADREAGTLDLRLDTEGFSAGTPATVRLPEIGVEHTVTIGDDGRAADRFQAPVELWSPEKPRLYDVVFSAGGAQLSERLGFRTIETRGDRIYLNGEPIKLRGIATHEEPIGEPGVAYSREQVQRILQEAKALNANFVRAAHYPYSRHMARAADELGIMLWEEVPVYWNIAWDNPDTLALARDLVTRLVQRDWNRASVVIWSVANETPVSDARMAFLGHLIDDVRALDDSRLVSAALLGGFDKFGEIVAHLAARALDRSDLQPKDEAIFRAVLERAGDAAPSPGDIYTLVIEDPLGKLTDIVAYNEYFGWYYSGAIARQLGVGEDVIRPLMLDFMRDLRIASAFDKPVHISEFGAGAKAGRRGGEALIWSEEYQARVYAAQIAMLRNSPQVQGMTPWVLKDFRAMLRPLAGIQDYYNRKGVIDENGRRKLAFDVLRTFYAGPWEDPARSGEAP